MAGARSSSTSRPKGGSRSTLIGKKAPAQKVSAPQKAKQEHRTSLVAKPKVLKTPAGKASRGAGGLTSAIDRGSRQQMGYLAPRRIKRAYDALVQDQVAKGTQDLRVSARVDPGILAAAARNLSVTQPSDVVNAAIIAAATQDPFKTWFLAAAGTLPEDFELAV